MLPHWFQIKYGPYNAVEKKLHPTVVRYMFAIYILQYYKKVVFVNRSFYRCATSSSCLIWNVSPFIADIIAKAHFWWELYCNLNTCFDYYSSVNLSKIELTKNRPGWCMHVFEQKKIVLTTAIDSQIFLKMHF